MSAVTKNYLSVLLSLVTVLVFLSCKKDTERPELAPGYIKGNFETELLVYSAVDTLHRRIPPDTTVWTVYNDSTYNLYTPAALNPAQGFGKVRMIRLDDLRPLRYFDMTLDSINIDSLQLPVYIDEEHPQNPRLLFLFVDYYNGKWDAEDSLNFFALSKDGDIRMVINDTANGTLSGTFEGVMRTGSGFTKKVSNGSFKVPILRKLR